jgi:hypothetical protein
MPAVVTQVRLLTERKVGVEQHLHGPILRVVSSIAGRNVLCRPSHRGGSPKLAGDDPYMRDPNIRSAANMVLIGWPLLLAALGSAAAGWFELASWIGILGGLVIGIVFSNLILRLYGCRSIR